MTALARTAARTADRFAFVPGIHGAVPLRRGAKKDPVQDIGPLAAIATNASFSPGASVVREGDRADHLFRIESGMVKVYRTLPDGRCQITGFLFAGDFIGLAPEDVYLSGAVAIGPVTVSRFARKKVEQLISLSPLVARLLLRRACSELIAAQDQMLLLGCKTAAEKVASFLLAIARRSAGDVMNLPMSRMDIADYLGLTIETVSRTLSQLREEGLIEVNRAEVRIMRPTDLEDLAEAA